MITSSYVGPEPLELAVGRLYIFYLRRQADQWRTAYDIHANCVDRVLTGVHPDFKNAAREPVRTSILRILLTKGENISDGTMVDAPGGNSFSLPYEDYGGRWRRDQRAEYIKILEQQSETETAPVRAEACELLGRLGLPCRACGPRTAIERSGTDLK